MEKKCSVVGCNEASRSRGMCWKHYMRQHRHGTAEDSGYGSKTKHPLYITWMSAKRGGVLCDAWREFGAFLAAVGDKPGDGWRLYRKDTTLPYQEGNVQWRELLFTQKKFSAEELKDVRNEVKKKRNREEHDPVKHRQRTLKTNHGMTVDEYQAMHDAQGGVCAICGRPETKARSNGIALPLAVDHCHKTRQNGESKGIRALLCQSCNIGLGKFDDDPDLIRKAAAYVEKYK